MPKTLLVRLIRLATWIALILIIAPTAFAQSSGSATLRGTVKDPSGALVPKATVTLVSDRTNDQRQVQTSDDGIYVFTAVEPGTYTLKVEGANFKTYQLTGLTLAPSDTKGQDVALEVGAQSETVTVTGESIQTIQTETGEKSNVITAAQIENLSLIGRNSLELLRVLPGVVSPDGPDLQVQGFGSGAGNTSAYTVNGLRGQNNSVTIDGSRLIDIGSNSGTIITPNNDMVQEVKVQTSNYAAEFGSSGVQISAVTKGGGNDYHGSLYEYSRPYQLAANDRQRVLAGYKPDGTLNSPRPKSKFNYPGGNISGPVVLPRFGEGGKTIWSGKNKLFFFVGLEVQRQLVDNGIKVGTVPTLLQRQGDYSEFLRGISTDATGKETCQTYLQQPCRVYIPSSFPGYVASGNRTALNPGYAPNNNLVPYINKTGQTLINLYPLPNFVDPSGRNNYISSALGPINRIDLKGRFDYKVSDKTNLYLRLARETEGQDGAFGIWWGPSNYELPSHNLSTNIGRSAALNVTSVLSPTMTNEVVFSVSRLKLDNNYADVSKVSLSNLGLGNLQLPFGQQVQTVPSINTWGGQGLGELYSGLSGPIFAHNDSYSINDNLSKIYNSHTLKFGALIEQANKQQNFQNRANGEIVINGDWTTGATGSSLGDLLVGRPNSFGQDTVVPNGKFRLYNIEPYAQDSWKVRPSVTLEYGLRVAYLPNNTELTGLGNLFDPSKYVRGAGAFINNDPLRPNGILSARRGEIPNRVLDNNAPQLAPRLGFAWDIGGKGDTVIRGGAGLFYNRVQGNFQYDPSLRNPPFGYRGVTNGSNEGTSAWLDGNTLLSFDRLSQINPNRVGGLSLALLDPESNFIPRTATMSLSFAKRLPFGNILEVAYVGTQGRHLPDTINRNRIPAGTLLSGTIQDPGRGKPGDTDYLAPVTLNLADPLIRAGLSGEVLNRYKPFPDFNDLIYRQFNGTSTYHSLQATLSRQLGNNLTYFATYTFSKALGTIGGDNEVDPVDIRNRSYGVLDFDRTHIINVSYNYNTPDIARGSFRNFLTKGILNGWQVSGISTFQSGTPIRLKFAGGDLNSVGNAIAFFGTDAFLNNPSSSGAITPNFTKNPQIKTNGEVGEKIFDISSITIPAFGTSGPNISPFYLRGPNRNNHDVSFFKNFRLNGDGTKRIQFRAGFFNIFNQAFPRDINNSDNNASDIRLRLEASCDKKTTVRNGAGGTTDVCDPTGTYSYSADTLRDFGTVKTKRGHRIIEVALKFYF